MIRIAEILVEDGHEVFFIVPKYLQDKIESKSLGVITFKVSVQWHCTPYKTVGLR